MRVRHDRDFSPLLLKIDINRIVVISTKFNSYIFNHHILFKDRAFAILY